MNHLFLSTLTKAVNTYLNLDPESRTRLGKLEGKIITVELLPFHATFHCHFSAHGVRIDDTSEESPHTTLRGTPLQMVSVLLTKENRHRFFADDLTITGNMDVGQQVVDLFDGLQIDWEEQLSRITGDGPAHHAGRLVRRASAWLKQVESSFTQNVSDYVHEEQQWLPTREALQDFFLDVDTLRMDVDRVEAKLRQLLSDAHQEEDQS